MKALTLWQPWATAVAHLGKQVENRTWAPPSGLIGKPLAIHAGKRVDKESLTELLFQMREGTLPRRPELLTASQMPVGHVVAVARVAGWLCSDGVIPMLDEKRTFHGITEAQATEAWKGSWWCGPVGWYFDRVLALPKPVPCSGAQGLWTLPSVVRADVLTQIQTLTVER